MRKCKIIVAMLLVFVVMTAFPTAAIAEKNSSTSEVVMPRLTYIAEAETDLSISGTTAIVDCWVKGNVLDATKAKVIAELQLKSGNSWMAYGTWTSTQNDYEAYVYETKSVKAGQTYRVKATYTVWEGSQSETIVVFSDEVTA